jgi:hypothetical protein
MTVIGHPVPASRVKEARTWLVLLPSAVTLALATPLATWWLVGPLNTAPARVGLDYAFRPWPINPAAARAAGIAATIVAVMSLTFLIWATARHRLDARWWRVLIPLLAAGFIAGAGWRVLTAGVLGANIAAGFVIMIGGPLVLILVAWALGCALYLGWGQSPPGPQGPPPDLLAWAQAVDVSRVTEHTAKAAEEYLRDYLRMTPLAGREFGLRLASLLETQVSPPPPLSLTPSDIAATVLAVRRKQLGIEDWPGWVDWPGRSDWSAWADWPGWNRDRSTSPQ